MTWDADGVQNSQTGLVNVTYPGFETDMMADGSTFSQEHIDNLSQKALDLSKTKGNNFVMAQKVDNASNSAKSSAPDTFKRGKVTYIKKE